MKSKLLFTLLVLLIGCNVSNTPLTETRKEAVIKEAAPVVKGFYDAMISNDTAKLMAFMDNSPETAIVNSSGVFTYDDMKKIVPQYFAGVEKQSFETKTEKYSVIDPSCFTYTWYGKNIVFIKGGEPIVYDDLMGSYTFRKTRSGWKVVYLHESVKTPEVADPVGAFTKLEEVWGDAMFKKDAKALDLIYASEYMYIDSKWKVNNKQQDISEITGPAYKVLAPFKYSDIKVSMYGTAAVVKGVVTSESIFNGRNISGNYNFMDIFVYRDGRWQCILSQYMPDQKK